VTVCILLYQSSGEAARGGSARSGSGPDPPDCHRVETQPIGAIRLPWPSPSWLVSFAICSVWIRSSLMRWRAFDGSAFVMKSPDCQGSKFVYGDILTHKCGPCPMPKRPSGAEARLMWRSKPMLRYPACSHGDVPCLMLC